MQTNKKAVCDYINYDAQVLCVRVLYWNMDLIDWFHDGVLAE